MIYVDVLLLVHTMLNGALLFLVGRWLLESIIFWRILVASLVGALIIVGILLSEWIVLGLFGHMVCTWVVLMIAFPDRGIRHRVRQWLTVYMASGLLIGCALVLEQTIDSDGMSIQTILLLLLGIVVVATQCRTLYRRRMWRSCTVPIKVCMGSISVDAIGLVDTGHHLRDPLTQTPVLIMDCDRWWPYIPHSWQEAMRTGNTESLVFMKTEYAWESRFRWVPFHGVGVGRQWMIAFSPDSVCIDERRVPRGKVLVGLRTGRLRTDDAYAALIPIALVA